MISSMKLWISDKEAQTHRLVRFSIDESKGYRCLGDLSDKEIKACLKEIKDDLDLDRHLDMIKYFGYLHLFLDTTNESLPA